MYSLNYLKSNFNPFRLVKTLRCKEWKVSPFHGIHMFAGDQGQGKTLTLVRFCKAMLQDYDLTVLSNVAIGDIDYIEWSKPCDIIRLIKTDGLRGCIVIVDEANVIFPSTDKPDRRFLELACMLRHYEIYLILTVQRVQRASKWLREQCSNITFCSIPFKGLSFNRTYSVDSELMLQNDDAGDIMGALSLKDIQIYFHHIDDYSRYDSHATIKFLEVDNDC